MSRFVPKASPIAAACASVFALAYGGSALATCTGTGAPATGYLACDTAIAIPGNPIRTFDISWVDSARGLYFLGDRSNKGVDIIDTRTNTWLANTGGFKGVVLTSTGGVNNNLSGPDGVTSMGNWLYAGDGDSTLKVIDITNPAKPSIVATLSTGGTTRLDEMALTADGSVLIASNNAEDPPFSTLFKTGGANTKAYAKIVVDPAVIPAGFGLSIEQPTWDPRIGRFLSSVPTIANNPAGCNYGQNPGNITCSGAMLVINPAPADGKTYVEKVVPLVNCGPNGITIGPDHSVMLGCTPGNEPGNNGETILDDRTFAQVSTQGVTGADEVWYDAGTNKYYTGSSKNPGGAVLGVVDGTSKFTIQTIPQSANSHSVAADARRHKVLVPQVAPTSVVGAGGDTTTVGAGICGTTNGCIAVYRPRVNPDNDRDRDDGHDR